MTYDIMAPYRQLTMNTFICITTLPHSKMLPIFNEYDIEYYNAALASSPQGLVIMPYPQPGITYVVRFKDPSAATAITLQHTCILLLAEDITPWEQLFTTIELGSARYCMIEEFRKPYMTVVTHY